MWSYFKNFDHFNGACGFPLFHLPALVSCADLFVAMTTRHLA